MERISEPSREDGSGASQVNRYMPSQRNWRVDLSYDGAGFHGFAENAGVRTIGGDLRAAIERVVSRPVSITVAGRTDAGVHALHQVVTFTTDADIDPARLRDSLNGLLAPSVAVQQISEVDDDFDARFSARWRSYRYRVLAAPVPDPFLAGRAWWVDDELDLDAMSAGATHLLGEHDFSSFCRRPRATPPVSLVRRVLAARWSVHPDDSRLVDLEITATAFCHQMVRAITGALVAVGTGRRAAADVVGMLERRSRDGMPQLAPPHGLYLVAVGYGDAPPPQDVPT